MPASKDTDGADIQSIRRAANSCRPQAVLPSGRGQQALRRLSSRLM